MANFPLKQLRLRDGKLLGRGETWRDDGGRSRWIKNWAVFFWSFELVVEFQPSSSPSNVRGEDSIQIFSKAPTGSFQSDILSSTFLDLDSCVPSRCSMISFFHMNRIHQSMNPMGFFQLNRITKITNAVFVPPVECLSKRSDWKTTRVHL